MALLSSWSTTARNAAVDAIAAQCNGGKLRIYGPSTPASADTAIGAQVQLAELTFGSPAFGAAVAGVATANALTGDASADATGTATFMRAFASNGTTVVFDGSAGTSSSNLNLSTTSIAQTQPVSVSSVVITLPIAGT